MLFLPLPSVSGNLHEPDICREYNIKLLIIFYANTLIIHNVALTILVT